MARRKRAATTNGREEKTGGGFGEWSFVKHSITREEKALFETWDVTPDDLWDMLNRLADSEYKVSVNYDDYNKCVTCSVACRNKSHRDFQLILTARAPDGYNAIRLALFKHFILLSESWLDWHEREGIDDVWG